MTDTPLEVYRSPAIRVQRFRDVKLGASVAAVSLGLLFGVGAIMTTARESVLACFFSVPALFAVTGFVVASVGSVIELARVLFAARAPGLVLCTPKGIYLCCGAAPVRLPFAAIHRVVARGSELALYTRTDDVIRIRVPDADALARLQRIAADPAHRPRPPADAPEEQRYPLSAVALLARNDRVPCSWKAALSDRVRGAEGGYRDLRLEAEDAAVVLEDERAPAELRIGAALALARAGDEVTAERLRIAVHFCPDRALRAALVEAAYGELDDEVLRQAIRGREGA